MAPATVEAASLHLAPLDTCFTRGHRLISWRTAYETLYECNVTNTPCPKSLVAFFADDRSVAQLRNSYQPFSQSSSATKNDFETRTNAVNVTPTDNGPYNIQEIKEDVLWLAEQAKIDEVSALRISILEWQTRSTARTLSGYAEEERISLQKALGREAAFPLQDTASNFASAQARRVRLVELFLEECLHIIRCHAAITSFSWLEAPQAPAERTYPKTSNKQKPVFGWIADIESKLQSTDRRNSITSDWASDLIIKSIDSIQPRLIKMERPPTWSTGDEDKDAQLTLLSQDYQLLELTSILQIIFISTCASSEPFNAATVQAWYSFIGNLAFFSMFNPPIPNQQRFVPNVQLMVGLISLNILKLPYALEKIEADQDPAGSARYYFQDDGCLQTMTQTLSDAGRHGVKIAGPAIFAMAMLLRTFRYQLDQLRGDTEDDDAVESPSNSRATPGTGAAQRTLEKILQHIPTFQLDIDPIQLLAHLAIDECQIFQVLAGLGDSLGSCLDLVVDLTPQLHARIALLELLRQGITVTSYTEHTIETSIALLGGLTPQADAPNVRIMENRTFVAETFLADSDILAPMIYEQARSRFPYEPSPFLMLNASLSQARPSVRAGADLVPFQSLIGAANKFTQIMPQQFTGYELVREDENANAIRLTEDLPLFESKRPQGSLRTLTRQGHDLAHEADHALRVIPSGTLGFVISENRPFVVVWDFDHSLWSYFGAVLSTIPLGSTRQEVVSIDSRLVATDMINVITAHMTSPSHGQTKEDFDQAARTIIEEASDCLDRGQDIIALVFEIFEEELSRHTEQRGEESTDLLVSCTKFIQAAVKLAPHRVWPAIARSQLLDTNGEGGKLMAVAGSTEIVLGRYDFLISTVHLYQRLVDDLLDHCVYSEGQSTALTKRVDRFNTPNARPPLKVTSSAITALTRTYLDVLQSSSEWTFADQEQQIELTTIITKTFDTILTAVYGYDDLKEPPQKITKALFPAAKHLSDTFLTEHGSQQAVSSLVLRCVAGVQTFQDIDLSYSHKMGLLLANVLGVSKTLLYVSSLKDLKSTYLDDQLFRTLASTIRLYALKRSLRRPTITLLATLVKKAGMSDQEPPSIFAHLGPDVSKDFLRTLGFLDEPFEDLQLRVDIWAFLEIIVASRQQWFATHMLTGADPRERLKTTKSSEGSSQPNQTLLETALDELSRVDHLQHAWTLAMLRFISQAQNHWPWVTRSIRKHDDFLARLSENASIVQEEKAAPSIAEQVQLTKQHSSVAVVAEILAMYLHNMRQMGDMTFVKQLVPKLGFLRQKGFFQPRYAEGLHQKLRANFESIFPGSTPQCFKRQFGASELGPNYYYDLLFSQKLLAFSPSWDRKSGFKEEFVRANINISLVESQIQAISSWRTLAVELSKSMEEEASLKKSLGYLVIECLEMCNSADLSHKIFTQVVSSCADLALTILQRLVAGKSNADVMKSILRQSWALVQRASEGNIFAGESAAYYRTSLKILFLAIQPHTWLGQASSQHDLHSKDGKISETSMILLDVITEVVGKGFRSLATELHESPQNVLPSDFALLTAILQAVMQVQGIESLHSLIALRLSDSGCARYAIALFSWCDRLTATHSTSSGAITVGQGDEELDPIYGELSLSFLLALSTLQPMAEFLASESILAQLNTAPLMAFFRRPGGSGPFSAPSPRLFTIWSRGVLPLCLNLLLTVGESIAMEVAMFLNNYTEQLVRASGGFDDKPVPSPRNPTAGCICLNMAAEAQTLALLSAVLDKCRASPSAAALGQIPEVGGWDRAMVKEDLEAWVGGSKLALRDRLLPMSEKEVTWLRAKPDAKASGDGMESRLEEMVFSEMGAALKCLSMSTG